MLSLNAISATAISESTGTFTGNLFAMVDELVADDGDYIYVLGPGQTAKLALTDGTPERTLTDPAVNTGHILSVRAYSPQSRSIQLDLYASSIATIVKTITQATTSGVAQFDFTLAAAEADAIPSADYTSGLQVWLTGLA